MQLIASEADDLADPSATRRLAERLGSSASLFVFPAAENVPHDVLRAVRPELLARWTYVIEQLADDPMQLNREVDWVIKQQLIQAYMEKNRLSWRDPKVSLMDLQYHDIRPDKGLYFSLVRRDLVDRITDDESIERAKHVPPQTTRARLRGEFIRQANLKGKDYRVDWVYLKLNDPERETILCKDPFQSHDERVERLIRSF